MAYSETRIVIGGLAHVPVLIFIVNFIKGKFGIKIGEQKIISLMANTLRLLRQKIQLLKKEKNKL